MKYPRTMPEDEKNFKIVPIGEHKFQITDIHTENEEEITAKCEVLDTSGEGLTLLHRITNNPSSEFFWLTKLFLKCIGEPHNGDVVIDTDAWIGRQFFGEVKHSTDGKYANIKKLIYKDDIKQFTLPVKDQNINPDGVTDPKDIQW